MAAPELPEAAAVAQSWGCRFAERPAGEDGPTLAARLQRWSSAEVVEALAQLQRPTGQESVEATPGAVTAEGPGRWVVRCSTRTLGSSGELVSGPAAVAVTVEVAGDPPVVTNAWPGGQRLVTGDEGE